MQAMGPQGAEILMRPGRYTLLRNKITLSFVPSCAQALNLVR